MALVSWRVVEPDHPGGGLLARIILAGRDRFDFVCVAKKVHPDLQPFVKWHRAAFPPGPLRLKWAAFYATAAVGILRARADVVHAMSPMPAVPNQVDLASINWCQAGYHEAAAGRPPGESRLTWRAARAFTLGLERFTYRPPRTRLAEVETAAAKATIERHYPDLPVVEIPLTYDLKRYRADADARARTRAEWGVGDDDVVALFAGRNWNAKGLDLALAGLADARRRGARRLELWVAGQDWAAKLKRMARRHGVADQVTLLGARMDLERHYAASDVFLLPTLYEHGSRASHEAAACGLPLLVTATSGPADLIGDDEGGIVIERDPESIGAALARVAADPALRHSMGQAARERMLALNGTGPEPYLELYERLANGRGP